MKTLRELLKKRDKVQSEYDDYDYRVNVCELTDDDYNVKMYKLEKKLKQLDRKIAMAISREQT